MLKLRAQLRRLYLLEGSLPADQAAGPVLLTHDGHTRAIVIDFDKLPGEDDAHWRLLCLVANGLQGELDLPAPAVSISGEHGFRLWLSLAAPIPLGVARQFVTLLREKYFPDLPVPPDAISRPVALPPCLHQGSGRWAAFINPGLGASFADEAGLEMAPPLAGQTALLEHLACISEPQFMHAMALLQPARGAPPAQTRAATPHGLLLKDATLEEIVNHLHAMQIEPTFRHLIARRPDA
ncbi:hypothetical protein [Massilia sp. TWP1-3-3]|uniref:hypothetical protein n=1 Tax=Massilia sp. TWP1-3-3 TaxID=2804573 RepID=UPI003CF232FE